MPPGSINIERKSSGVQTTPRMKIVKYAIERILSNKLNERIDPMNEELTPTTS